MQHLLQWDQGGQAVRTPGLLDCTTSGGYWLCITYHIWWPVATAAGCGLGLDGPISLASTILATISRSHCLAYPTKLLHQSPAVFGLSGPEQSLQIVRGPLARLRLQSRNLRL